MVHGASVAHADVAEVLVPAVAVALHHGQAVQRRRAHALDLQVVQILQAVAQVEVEALHERRVQALHEPRDSCCVGRNGRRLAL